MKECTSSGLKGVGQVLILSTFLGFGDIPFTDRMWTRNVTLFLKEERLLRFNFEVERF